MTPNSPDPERPAGSQKLDAFVAIARAFSAPDATEQGVLRQATDMRRKSENRPPEVRRQHALDALAAIQQAFQKSGITEAELLAEGRRIRRQLTRERYGDLRRKPGTSAKDS